MTERKWRKWCGGKGGSDDVMSAHEDKWQKINNKITKYTRYRQARAWSS